jgi:HPt (histidine-containing phosphotransfer) domain-containing protein
MHKRRSTLTSIDVQTVLERCMGCVEFAESLLVDFEVSSRQRAAEIARLAVHRRWADLADAAHALKGAAAIVGAERLRALAAAAEQAGRSGELCRTSQVVEELYQEVQSCANDIKQLVEQWRQSRDADQQQPVSGDAVKSDTCS